MITLIAAAAENNALGKDNDLLWHLPEDFKRFKQITSGHFIIMGRKTFESFPKPLPNRTHIIITRQEEYLVEGCLVVHSLEEALEIAPQNEEVFIIGGAQIYEQALPLLNWMPMRFSQNLIPPNGI
jgi:dihydrofolate reductase